MCIQKCACAEGTSRPNVPPLFFDAACHRPPGALCEKAPARKKGCLLKLCDVVFNPVCYLMIFCSRECYEKSGIKPYWEALWNTYGSHRNRKSASRALRKRKFRETDNGKEQHRRESKRRYHKKKNAEPLSITIQSTALPDSPSASPVASVVPAPVSTPAPEKIDVLPILSLSSPAVTEPDTELPSLNGEATEVNRKRDREILHTLFSGKARREIMTPTDADEAIPTTIEAAPRCCKRPGCDEVVRPRSLKTEKEFCSRSCVTAIRNILQTLREAFKTIRCPCIRLLILLFERL